MVINLILPEKIKLFNEFEGEKPHTSLKIPAWV
jgi:hypothetical protein